MFLRELRIRVKGKEYSYWRIVKTYWDKEKKQTRHKTILNLGRLKEDEINQIKAILSFKKLSPSAFITSWEHIKVKGDYQFLLPALLDKLWHLWGLDKVTNSGEVLKVPTSKISEILSLNRAISPSSDLRVCDWYKETILPKLFKVEPELVNPTRIYRTLDRILSREEEIQNHLATRIKELGYDDLSLVFYDITSSYFEGWSCPIAEFGFSRDYRKNNPQILLALAVTKEGFPFYWRVLPGGLHDSVTVGEMVDSLKRKFNIKDCYIVMDKGMVSKDNLEFLEKENFFYIVTIPRNQVKNLSEFPREMLERLGKELEEEGTKESPDLRRVMDKYPYFTYFLPRAYFHELKKEGDRRYILCFNPEKFLEERTQREKKLSSIRRYLDEWNEKLSHAMYNKDRDAITKEIYHYLAKRKAESLFHIQLNPYKKKVKGRTVTTYRIDYRIKKDKLENLKLSDGIYCILSNLPEREPSFLLSSYRQRRKVEVAFSYLKGFIEIRPFYHQKESRVKAHILFCILGYLLQVTVEYLLKKKGYNITFQQFYQKVKRVRAVELEIENIGKKGLKLTEIGREVYSLLEALNTKDILSKIV